MVFTIQSWIFVKTINLHLCCQKCKQRQIKVSYSPSKSQKYLRPEKCSWNVLPHDWIVPKYYQPNDELFQEMERGQGQDIFYKDNDIYKTYIHIYIFVALDLYQSSVNLDYFNYLKGFSSFDFWIAWSTLL